MKKVERTKIWFIYTKNGVKIATLTGPDEQTVLNRAVRLLSRKPDEIYARDSGKIKRCGSCGRR